MKEDERWMKKGGEEDGEGMGGDNV